MLQSIQFTGRLKIFAVLIDYVGFRFLILSNVDEFTLQGTFMADSPLDDVYLFIFPTDVDNSRGHLTVRLPPENEAYYWSFDPEGKERAPQDALDKLTLPRVDLQALVCGVWWRPEVYNLIADFHRLKGFNPTSQAVAIKLGYPLMEVDRLINLIEASKVRKFHLVECREIEH
jgi:hypothetical protein